MSNNFVPVPFTGGVNLHDDARLLREDQVREAKNLFPYSPGILSKRKVAGTDAFVGLDLAHDFANMIVPPFDTGMLAVVAGGRFNDGYMNASIGHTGGQYNTSAAQRARMIETSRRPMLVAYQRKVYVLGGYPWTTPGVVGFINGFGTPEWELLTFLGTGNTDVIPRVAGVYKGRMVYADLGPGYEDYVVFADRFLPTTIGNSVLAANGRSFRIGARSGDRIVALVEIDQATVGSPSQSALLILREHSAFLISGEPNQSTDTDDIFGNMTVAQINIQTGCASAETVVRTPYGIIWAGHEDVWLMDLGATPRPIGQNIRPALERTPATDRDKWHAVYFDGIYRLAIHGEGQGALPTTSGNYFSVLDQWWLDLRKGPPQSAPLAQWWGPQQYLDSATSGGNTDGSFHAPSIMAVDNRPGHTPRLLGFYPDDDATGDVLVLDRPGVVEGPYGETSDEDDVFVKSRLRTRTFTVDGMAEMTYQGVEVRMRSTLPVNLQAEGVLNEGQRIDTASRTFLPVGFQTDVDNLDVNMPSAFVTETIWAAGAKVGDDLHVVIEDKFGYAVGPTNKKFYVWVNGVGQVQATLTEGNYLYKALYIAEVIAALERVAPAPVWANSDIVASPHYKVRITTTNVNWYPIVAADGALTFDQLAESRRVWGALGFDTTANPAAGFTHDGVEGMQGTRVSPLEIGGIVVRVDAFGRRP